MHGINWQSPVSTDSLNRDLRGWWLNVPHWRGGTTWRDLTSRQSHGTLTSADGDEWVSPQNRQGSWGWVHFDGTNDQVNVGAKAHLQITGSLTLAMWIRYTSRVSNRYWLSMDGNAETEATNILYGVFTGNTQADLSWFHEYGNGSNEIHTFDTNIGINVAHHVVFVRDATATTIDLYMDGAFHSQQSYTNNATGGTSSELHFGSSKIATNVISGRMDDIRIWARALRPREAIDIYRETCHQHPRTLRRVRTDASVVAAAPAGGITAGSLGLCGVGI